ncbi:MAG TPA: hypothetical protein VIV12_00800 [Streptosporangiaceae bacterium]
MTFVTWHGGVAGMLAATAMSWRSAAAARRGATPLPRVLILAA